MARILHHLHVGKQRLSLSAYHRHEIQGSKSPPASQAFSFAKALPRCEIRFYKTIVISNDDVQRDTKTKERVHTFSTFSISAYVSPFSNSKTASHPKTGGPRAGTILPLHVPWKRIGSWSGPAQYANVQTAKAVLSSYAASMLFRPSWPRAWRKYFLQGERNDVLV